MKHPVDLLLEARPVRLADVISGAQVKVAGYVRYGRETLVAPLSGIRCAAYQVIVGERPLDPFFSNWLWGRRSWRQLHEETAARDFLLDDGTAQASVAAGSLALINDHFDLYEESGLFRTIGAAGRALIRRLGFSGRAFTVAERRIVEGQCVAVYGRCSLVADPSGASDAQYRTAASRIRLEGAPLLISSEPRCLT